MYVQSYSDLNMKLAKEMEVAIVLHCEGIIQRSFLYEVCRNKADVIADLNVIKNPSLYLSIDPAVWIASQPLVPESGSKKFKVKELRYVFW